MREAVPPATARLSLPIPNLLDLPDGAGYTARDGRSFASVRRDGDSLVVTAQCDSVSRLCLFLYDSLEERRHEADSLRGLLLRERNETHIRDSTYRADTFRREEKSRSGFSLGDMIMAFIAGLAAGAVFVMIKCKKV